MGALDKIAGLHSSDGDWDTPNCVNCGFDWPCPTRRLADAQLVADAICEVPLDWRKLRDAILDIDAHATPYGEDADGFITRYVMATGPLHRALGLIGHGAAKCSPEYPCFSLAQRDAARADAERLAAAIRGASVRTMRQEDALAAHDALCADENPQ